MLPRSFETIISMWAVLKSGNAYMLIDPSLPKDRIEYMLENAKIIQKESSHIVGLGSTVTISYVDDDDEEVYSIVGSMEADPFENKISNESPLGKAIIGKKQGDVLDVSSPTGSYQIKIVKVD